VDVIDFAHRSTGVFYSESQTRLDHCKAARGRVVSKHEEQVACARTSELEMADFLVHAGSL
jgi:hypothetical protein